MTRLSLTLLLFQDSEVERRVRNDAKDEELVERRRSEIYQTLTEARERANREAEKEAEEERRYWEDQGESSGFFFLVFRLRVIPVTLS